MRFKLLVFLLLPLGFLRAAPLERDLGGGLIYYRVRNLPADLPETPSAPKRTFVLDLRFTPGNRAAADTLASWLKMRATNRTPVFVLANASTSGDLLALLARRNPNEGVLVLGAASPGFSPDIPVPITPEAERQAYDYFETHPDANALLKENTSKVRNDEARLSREHASGAGAEETIPESPGPSRLDEKAPAPSANPPQPVDYVLQRALHLHRALLALKKI